MRMIFGALLAIWSAVNLAPSPQQVGPRPTITVETDLVMLPVTVVDRHGVLVTGLAKENFKVYDGDELQAIEFFTRDDTPATVGLVIDSSSSMRGRRAQVTAAATAFATLSHPLDELFTVNFNEAVWFGLPHSVRFAQGLEQLHAALDGAPAAGMTALYDAVAVAIDHLQLGTRDRKALIVVSDGGDNASTHTLDQVLNLARRTNTTIYALILFEQDDVDARPAVLKRLARDTGGEVFTPRQSQEVMSAFAQIAREMRNGYTIGFSPRAAADGGFRTIRVVADSGEHRQFVVRTRAGYYPRRALQDDP